MSISKLEIRNTLNAHKEHFRVLPTLAMIELTGLIDLIDKDLEAKKEEIVTSVEAKKEEIVTTVEAKRDLGNRASKAAKKSKRSKK